MQWVSREEYFDLLGITEGAYDQMQHAGHVALAFGATLPGTPGRYLDLDVVSLAMVLGLTERGPGGTPGVDRRLASRTVLNHFAIWGNLVARAEADPGRDFFFALGAFGIADFVERRPKFIAVAGGTMSEVNAGFTKVHEPLMNQVYINVSEIIRTARRRARERGINLEAPFLFLPDDPRFKEFLGPVVEREQAARDARQRRNPKKSVVKKRAKDIEIKALPVQPEQHAP